MTPEQRQVHQRPRGHSVTDLERDPWTKAVDASSPDMSTAQSPLT